MAVTVERGVSLLNETDRFVIDQDIINPSNDTNQLITHGFREYAGFGSRFLALLFNLLLSMPVGNSIHIPVYENQDTPEETVYVFKITRNSNSYSYTSIETTTDFENMLLSAEDVPYRNEFEGRIGAIKKQAIETFIDAINHIQQALCVTSTFSGGTGGTGRKHLRGKRKHRTQTRRRRKSRKHRTLKRH